MLQLRLCLLRRLRRGRCDTVLKYERTIMCTLLYNSKWQQDLPGQAHSEEFGEGMMGKLVRDKAKHTSSVTVEEVENHYLLLKVGPGGKRVGVQNVPANLVRRMRQGLTRFLATDRNCMAYVEWEPDRVSTVATSWPRRLPRFFHPHQRNPLVTTTTGYLVTTYSMPSLTKKNAQQPTETETGFCFWAEKRCGCRLTGSSNAQPAATHAVTDTSSARGLAH